MSASAEKKMKEKVKKLKKSGVILGSPNKRTSLEDDLAGEIRDVGMVLNYLSTYRGQHEVLVTLQKKMKATPNWVPTPKERGLFFAVMRQQMKGRSLATQDPLAFAISLEADDRPSSLD